MKLSIHDILAGRVIIASNETFDWIVSWTGGETLELFEQSYSKSGPFLISIDCRTVEVKSLEEARLQAHAWLDELVAAIDADMAA